MTAAGPADRPDRAPAEVTADEPVERARELLRTRGRAVRDEQLARACQEADLTDAERAAIARLADRLVARLLAGSRRSLRRAPDRERVATTVEDLFE